MVFCLKFMQNKKRRSNYARNKNQESNIELRFLYLYS